MKKFGKFLSVGLLSATILGGNALAASVSTGISDKESSAMSSSMSVNLGVSTELYGSNYSTSSNNVYVQKIREVAGPDDNVYDYKIAPGTTGYKRYSTTGKTGNYYVKLNPEGPYAKGVNGYGRLTK